MLEKTPLGAGGELQLTDGIRGLLQHEKVYGYSFDGLRFDAGDKLGMLKATVEFALNHNELGTAFREYLKSFVDLINCRSNERVQGRVSPAVIGRNVNIRTRKDDQVDDYHGTKVADPYRWLEDDNSAETLAWVNAQNQVTLNYLEQIPYRSQLKQRLEELYNYPKYGIPSRSGAYYLWSKNDGLQNQSVLYVQKGLRGNASGFD